jgi:hypothetical protein
LREAHAWVSQVREMDALQSQSLQVELRERMEQFNQYWISSQQQVCFSFPVFIYTLFSFIAAIFVISPFVRLQFTFSCFPQYAEMQRSLLHTIQQLQQELTEAREQSGAQKDGPQVSREGSAESSLVQSMGNSVASNGSATADGNQQLLKNNGSVDVSVQVLNYFSKRFIYLSM